MSYRIVLGLVVAAVLMVSTSITAASSSDPRFRLAAVTISNQFVTDGTPAVGDGAKGILGFVTFVDNGKSLHVTGTAINLVAGQQYFSLLYDRGSVPSGADACLPSSTDQITEEQMVVGLWQGTGSTRTIDVTKTKTGIAPAPPVGPSTGNFYVPIGRFATMSIRNATAGFILQSCGLVVPGVVNREGD